MAFTAEVIASSDLTALMVTHHFADALQYGNRLILLHQGRIVLDMDENQKKALSVKQLLDLFHQYAGATI
jgi:putative ABC transport system ATP-binding protein